MQRRDVIKLLASSAALSALPFEVLQSLQQARAEASPASNLRTFDAHQNETIVTITELIIPATDTPGAKGAKVNEFLDLLLTEWFDPDDTREFLSGLAKVDADSRSHFGKDFIRCTDAQRMQLMKQWDEHAIAVATGKVKDPAASMHHREHLLSTSYTTTPPPTWNFFYTLKKLTLVGYYTSEIGFSKELRKEIIPSKHAGCAPVEARA